MGRFLRRSISVVVVSPEYRHPSFLLRGGKTRFGQNESGKIWPDSFRKGRRRKSPGSYFLTALASFGASTILPVRSIAGAELPPPATTLA